MQNSFLTLQLLLTTDFTYYKYALTKSGFTAPLTAS